MKAVIYLRVSTDDQCLGIDGQRSACEAYCEKNGIEISGVHIDEGLSGGLPPQERPSLLSALDSLGKDDILLVAKRDRVARCKRAVSLIEMAVEAKKGRIISTQDEGTWAEDENDPMAFMMRSMADTFAQFERLIIRQRTRTALAVKKSRGERTGHIPFGFMLAEDGVHLEVNEEEQSIIKLIVELKESGMSVRKISEELNKRQKFNRGSTWTKSSTHRILQKAA